MPNGSGKVNQKAVEFYTDMFRRIKKEGINLMVNLYHFDMPMALQRKGGWKSRETVYAYQEYAKTCITLFGEYVDAWFTFNEPIVHVECGYLYQYHYPCKVDAKSAVQVAYHTQLASSMAIKCAKEINEKIKIGIILNLTPVYPRSNNKADLKAAEVAELFQTKSFLDPSVKGYYPEKLVSLIRKHHLMPHYIESDLEVIQENTVDFLGINYYQPLRVMAPKNLRNPEVNFSPDYYFDRYVMPGRKINAHRGWEIYERGIYDTAMSIKNNYNNISWVLTENGMGVENEHIFRVDGQIQDDYRINFIKEHLRKLHQAIQKGANCKGYLLWTFIDCWSWLNAYKNRYGLIELNLETQERVIKKSGEWFKDLSKNNGFEE